jgi:hypothetical protein
MADDSGPAAAAAGAGDEVKPYKIHVSLPSSTTHQKHPPIDSALGTYTRWQVSSRYLDLTKQKLEITRLPREPAAPKSHDWWEPKAQVEPLIDFW